MKKIPILSTIIILSLALIPLQSASAITAENGTTWWTVEELLDFYPEVEAEKEAKCGENEECKMEFTYSLYEKGPKYSALENLTQGQLWITSVNPAEETIKVFYFDQEMMLHSMGIDRSIHLEHLYIGWIEEWNGQIYNYNHERFTNGSMTGNHPMYEGSSSIEGSDWIPAWEEYEISVAGSNLIENTHGKIDYAVYAENNMFNAQGYFDISSCLNSPDYQVGMECKMYVSGDQWVSYFPPREQIIEQDEQNNSEPEIEPSITEVPDEPEILPQDEPQETPIESVDSLDEREELSRTELMADIEVLQSLELDSNQKGTNLKSPETGQNTLIHEYSTEMPWWITLLNLFGVLLVAWWFMPTKQARIKKRTQKSQKKVLTKKPDCDKMVSV